MNYEDRANVIGTLLREHILPRYKRPEHLDDTTARAELRDMVDDLNRAWPVMAATKFGETADALARAIRTTHTSRSWPTIAALVKALTVALAPPAAVVSEGRHAEAEEAIYRLVVDWWREFHDAMPSAAKTGHAARMQQEGIATWGELRRAGFPIPDFAMGAARSEPDPRHAAIMEEIHAIGQQLKANGAPRGDFTSKRGSA